MSELEDPGKYHVENRGPVQGLVPGDRNTVHMQFNTVHVHLDAGDSQDSTSSFRQSPQNLGDYSPATLKSGMENAHQDWGEAPVPRIISQKLYEELRVIADEINLSKKDLMGAFYASVSSSPLPPEIKNKLEYEILAFMLEKLTQLGEQSTTGKWPIFEFIRYLIKYTSGQPIHRELVLWLKKCSKEKNIPLPEESVNTTPAQDVSLHLLVKFELNCFNEDEVYIKAWFLSEQNGKIKCLSYSYEEQACPLANAPTLLGDLILNGEESFAKRFTIELFLPFNLLNHSTHDVHQWKFRNKLNSLFFVAHEHPLVLRSYERVYQCRPTVDLRWKENEEICKKYVEDRTKMSWVTDLKFVREESYKEDILVDYEKAPCLIITFVPPKYDISVPCHIFKDMISAGTSVALWLRSGHELPNQDAVEQACQTLLRECEFSKVPEMIWERRRDAPRDKSSIVNYLTLFWDSRCRLPLDAPNVLKKSRPKKRK